MSRTILLTVFVTLIIFTSYCSEQCGFPGQPKNGTVGLQLDPRLLNERNATYSCNDNHVLVPSSGRRCVGGRWDGDIPQCLEIVNISRIFEDETRNTKDLRSGCQIINTGYFYKFQIEKERRLHSVRLRTTSADWQYFEKAVFAFHSWKNDQSKRENLNVSRRNHEREFSSSLVLNRYSNYHFKNFGFTSNSWVYVCHIELIAYHDECGLPEVPLHGHVQLEPNDTKATYRCEDGFQLDSNNPIRHCIQGRWNGSQPICRSKMLRESMTQITLTLIVTCCGLLIVVLCIVYQKKRTTPVRNLFLMNEISTAVGSPELVNVDIATGNLTEEMRNSVRREEHPHAEIRNSLVSETSETEPIYDEIRFPRDSQESNDPQIIPEGFQGYEIPNHIRNLFPQGITWVRDAIHTSFSRFVKCCFVRFCG